MPEKKYTLSNDTTVSLSQLAEIIEGKVTVDMSEDWQRSIDLARYAYKILPGRTLVEKSKSIVLGRGNSRPSLRVDKNTMAKARMGDGMLKTILSELSIQSHPLLKYPVEVYQTNFYISEVVVRIWPVFKHMGGDVHDMGTIYEWILGLLYQYGENKHHLTKFVKETLFTFQDKIVQQGIKQGKFPKLNERKD